MRIPRIPIRPLVAATAMMAAAAILVSTGMGQTHATEPTNPQVAENSPGGTAVGTPMNATATSGTVNYSLSGTDAANFVINPSSGEISLAPDTSPDFEAKSTYVLNVVATVNVTVQVENVSEMGSLHISPHEPGAGETITATLSDPDGQVSNVSWQWGRSNAQGWNAITGANQSSYVTTSADIGYKITAQVTYDDPTSSGNRLVATTAGAVANDPPTFSTQQPRSVDENSAAGTDVGTPVLATDPNGHSLTYTAAGDSAFTVEPQSGQIRVATGADLNYEESDSSIVTITADDSHDGTAAVQVQIQINNVDEPGAVTLSYSTLAVGATMSASLTDPDGAPSDISWKWMRNRTIIADETSSEYTATNHDVGRKLTATATYSDPQGTGKTASATTDEAVANNPPIFMAGETITFTIDENSAAGAAVGTLVATEPNGDATAFEVTGTDDGKFTITPTGISFNTDYPNGFDYSVQITIIESPDYETQASYEIAVTAYDSNQDSDTIDVTVNVNNIDEPGVITFDSDQPEVDNHITASLSDPDGNVANTTWLWQWATSADGPWTNLEDGSAAFYKPTSDDVNDYLRVTTTYNDDAGSNQDSVVAIVANSVAPEPNEPPEFDSHRTTFNISINVAEGVRVAPPFTATDPNDDELTYSIVSDTANAFTINSATGEVLMGSLAMPEGSVYTATVSVSDGHDVDRNEDDAADDSVNLTMTMVNPNIAITAETTYDHPYGLWRNDDIVVLATNGATDDQVLFYDADAGQELNDRNFEVTAPNFPNTVGLWSDGTTLYLLNNGNSRDKVYGYRLNNGNRQGSKDFNLVRANANPAGMHGKDDVLYVGDSTDRKIYAYNLSNGQRLRNSEIDLDTYTGVMTELWMDDGTVWVSIWRGNDVLAFSTEDGSRQQHLDIRLATNNRGPTGIYSDGFSFWALDQVNDTIYGYVLPQ